MGFTENGSDGGGTISKIGCQMHFCVGSWGILKTSMSVQIILAITSSTEANTRGVKAGRLPELIEVRLTAFEYIVRQAQRGIEWLGWRIYKIRGITPKKVIRVSDRRRDADQLSQLSP